MLPTETKLLEREPDKIQAGFQRREEHLGFAQTLLVFLIN